MIHSTEQACEITAIKPNIKLSAAKGGATVATIIVGIGPTFSVVDNKPFFFDGKNLKATDSVTDTTYSAVKVKDSGNDAECSVDITIDPAPVVVI